MTSSEARAALLREAPDPATESPGSAPTVYPVTVEVPVVAVAQSDLGGWQIDKRVVEHTTAIDASAVRDAVQVERRSVNRWLAEGESPEPRHDGDDLVIPVIEEVAVVQRRLRVTEEIVVRRRRDVENRSQPVTLRREDVSVQRLPPDNAPPAPHSPTDPRSSSMTQTVIAVFDNAQQAERARAALIDAGYAADDMLIQAQPQTGTSASSEAPSERGESGITGFFRRLFGFNEDDADVSMYSEAIRRGNCVLSVHTGDEQQLSRAESILKQNGAIDVDERASQWRTEGWNPSGVTAAGGAAGMQGDMQRGLSANVDRDDAQGGPRTRGGPSPDKTLPVIEEELQVGTRPIQRGGLRIYSRVTERPVEESVQLREERARVERRPADRPATEADLAAMKDTRIEVRESAEEPVVSKQARVVEEVEVGKDVAQRTEKVRGTIRKTDVGVERIDRDAHATAAGRPRDATSANPDAATSATPSTREETTLDRAKAAAERGADKLTGKADRTRK